MDFFAAEGRAKKRTTRLLVLFGLAVAGTVVAGYLATVVALHAAGNSGYTRALLPLLLGRRVP
jgi:ABC-type phosphate/phosphonate transport system permease subunit